MKWIRLPYAALAISLLAGCYSMDISVSDALRDSAPAADGGRRLEHVVVSNYGWYLFNAIPLACGNARPGASFPWTFFSDHVTADILHDRLMAHAAAIRADAHEIIFFRNERVLFNLPGLSLQVPIPYLLAYREMQFSAVLAQRRTPEASAEEKKRKAVEEMNHLLERLGPEGGR